MSYVDEREYRVWWIPQIPGKPFEYVVPDKATGELLMDALAEYDIFQYENRIKPDFSNAGGLQERHPELTEGEWWDVEEEDEWS